LATQLASIVKSCWQVSGDEFLGYIKQIPLQWFKKQYYYDTCSAQVVRLLEDATLDWRIT
jgi:hypothetical protein